MILEFAYEDEETKDSIYNISFEGEEEYIAILKLAIQNGEKGCYDESKLINDFIIKIIKEQISENLDNKPSGLSDDTPRGD